MLKFNRTHKRLVIPAGINPNYGIDSSALYNTSDADAKPEDILAGITAYSDNGKIVGTLDVEAEIEESFNEGVQVQKSKLESISITENGSYSREDGWDEVIVDVPDLNGDYNEGLEEGIEIGKAEIIDGMNDATITAGTVFKGEIGYGKNGERIVGDFESLDFKMLGYSDEDSENVNIVLSDSIDYSKQLLDEWDPNNTSAANLYQYNYKLSFVPKIDTSKVTNMNGMFRECYALTFVPLFDTSNVTNMQHMFVYCRNLPTVPLFDTSKVTNMGSMFSICTNLKSVPLFNTSNVTYMRAMFELCNALTTVPLFDTSKVTDMNGMFRGCDALTTVPLFDTSKVTDLGRMFDDCPNLTSVPLFDTSNVINYDSFISGCPNLKTLHELDCSKIQGTSNRTANISTYSGTELVDFGGFKDLGKSFISSSNDNYGSADLKYIATLSYESCMNVINKVYDMNLTTLTRTPKIRFHATPYALLSADDIAIATSKGWAVQVG